MFDNGQKQSSTLSCDSSYFDLLVVSNIANQLVIKNLNLKRCGCRGNLKFFPEMSGEPFKPSKSPWCSG